MVIEMVTIDTMPTRSESSSGRGISGGAGTQWVRSGSSRPIRAISVLMSKLALWYRKRCSRRALAELDDHLLRDVGITQHEARRELRKSIYLF